MDITELLDKIIALREEIAKDIEYIDNKSDADKDEDDMEKRYWLNRMDDNIQHIIMHDFNALRLYIINRVEY